MQLILTDEEIDDIVEKVFARMEENTSKMFDTLQLKVKAENIEGLKVEHIEDFDEHVGNAVDTALDNATVEVDVDARIRT